MNTNDILDRHGKERERITTSQIVGGSEGELFKVVKRSDILRANSRPIQPSFVERRPTICML